MLRLHGYREYIKVNYYDVAMLSRADSGFGAANSASALEKGHLRLFTNEHIGDSLLTNMVISGQLGGDITWLVRNWYAHTNIPDSPELQALAAVTFATFVIGMMPFWRLPLSDLLRRREDHDVPPNEEEQRALAIQHDERVDFVAADLWGGYNGVHEMGYRSCPEAERGRWKNAASKVLRRLEPKDFLLVPIRQCFSIHIDTDVAAFAALRDAFDRHPVSPGPRVWFHLQGWQWRDVG